MTSLRQPRRPARLMRSCMMVALSCAPTGVAAQMVQPIPGMTVNDPVDMLSMHLRTLAANPRNLSALLGAGKAALDVGDPNAALGFFARADEIDARSGKAKAGLASALVMLEKPDDALRLFGEASSLGVSDSEIARDRGLAYDLRGDNRRAQRDYALALRRGPDDEVVRRYALSLGISGDRGQALTLLDPLLRKQDQGAWRARAFIMAMNNDVSGANSIARQVMPVGLAGTMAPFLSRLAKLNPAERAHAVNFGTMPSDGQTFASVQMGDPFKPVGGTSAVGSSPSAGLIPAGPPLGRQTASTPVPVARKPVTVAVATPAPSLPSASTAAPGFSSPTAVESSTRLGTRVGTRIAAVDPAKLPPEARGEPSGVTRVTTMSSLPPPDMVRAPVTIAAAPTPAPVPAPVILAPTPTPTPAPVPVATPPVVATPNPAPSVITAVSIPASTAPATAELPKPVPTPVLTPPVQIAVATPQPAPVVSTPVAAPVVERPGPGMTTVSPLPPAPKMEPDAGVVLPSPGFVGPPADPQSAIEVAISKPAPAPDPVKPVDVPPPVSRLASILSGIEPESESAPVALPTAAEIKAAQRAVARKTAAATEAAVAAQLAKDEKAKEAAAAKANPARLWVQVATGSNPRGLGLTWRKIRESNASLLKPYGGYSVAFRATNRVLAGPVKSSADARALVNALGKAGVSATTYSSEAGQEVVKLAAR